MEYVDYHVGGRKLRVFACTFIAFFLGMAIMFAFESPKASAAGDLYLLTVSAGPYTESVSVTIGGQTTVTREFSCLVPAGELVLISAEPVSVDAPDDWEWDLLFLSDDPNYSMHGSGMFTMPAHDVSLAGYCKPFYAPGFSTMALYTVKHYKVNADCTDSTLYCTEYVLGEIFTTVAAEPLEIPGYSCVRDFDMNGMISRSEGIVSEEDGSLELALYYLPHRTFVEVHYNMPGDPNDLSETVSYYYVGESFELPDWPSSNNLKPNGYDFAGYNTDANGDGTSYAVGDRYVVRPDTEENRPPYLYTIHGAGSGVDDGNGGNDLWCQWVPKDDAPYEIRHYKLNKDQTIATLFESEQKTGSTGEEITASALSVSGYSFNPYFDANGMKSISTGTVSGDGDLVLELYYMPYYTNLWIEFNYPVPQPGASGNPLAASWVDEIITIDNWMSNMLGQFVPGYTFAGYNTKADGSGTWYFDGDPYKMLPDPEPGVMGSVLYAQWKPRTDTLYKVRHYKLDAKPGEGHENVSATLAREESLSGTTGQTVAAAAADFAGYIPDMRFDYGGMKTVTSAVLSGDGTTVLNVYYIPQMVFPFIHCNWQDFDDILDAYWAYDAGGYVDSTIAIPEYEGFLRPGYSFVGYNTKADGSGTWYSVGDDYVLQPDSEMENGNELYAQWEPRADTAYKVEHYKIDLDLNIASLALQENLAGTTDTSAEASTQDFPGYAPIDGYLGMKSVFTGNIEADGSTVLSVYYMPEKRAVLASDDTAGEASIMTLGYGYADGYFVLPDYNGNRAGYDFAGYNTVADGDGDMYRPGDLYPVSAAADSEDGANHLHVVWKARDDTPYTVERYVQSDGVYPAGPSGMTTMFGTTGTWVELGAEDISVLDGYELDPDHSLTSGFIAGDGSLVLKVFFKVPATAGSQGSEQSGEEPLEAAVPVSESFTHDDDVKGTAEISPQPDWKAAESVAIAKTGDGSSPLLSILVFAGAFAMILIRIARRSSAR